MFKSLIVINVLILLASGEEVPVVATNETFVAIGSNSNETESSSSTVSIEHVPIKSINDSSSAYSAQFNPKLLQATNNTLVNTQARTIELTRNSLVQTPVNTSNGAVNSTSLLLILTSLIVVTCVVLIILTALFIMRRRFSIWRLNNSKLNLNGDSPNGTSSNEESKHDDEESGKKEGAAATGGEQPVLNESNCLTTVENKQSIMDTVAPATEPPTTTEDNQCHLNQAAEETNQTESAAPVEDEPQQRTDSLAEQQQHISSTSSLIVNVLNELSESVAAKLAAKSPTTRSTHSTNDPEKQPLNE